MEKGMKTNVFRQKSMDRISSPEQLQDYMHVTSPGVWMVLAAIIVLLAGFLVGAVVGRLETTVKVQAKAENGVLTAWVPMPEAEKLSPGLTLRVKGQTVQIESVSFEGDAGAEVSVSVSIPNGSYDAEIVTDVISPIQFLTN